MSGAPFVIPHDTSRRQREASDPTVSAWVSANAGSGKTYVLAQRVIRLLLAGSAPSRLLCLTFTKAAAATMSNRVFATLAGWTALDDAKLTARLTDLGIDRVEPETLARARRLFAEAIETPGGLKIQTIHAFCTALLQRFPLEADLAGAFETLDDRASAELKAEARDTVLARAGREGDAGPLGRALATAMSAVGESGIGRALDLFVDRREAIANALREHDSLDDALAALATALGLRPGDSVATLTAEITRSPEFEAATLSRWLDLLRTGSKTDVTRAETIGAARLGDSDAWLSVFLTKAGTVQTNQGGTKKIHDAMPDLAERFEREAARLLSVTDRLRALAAMETNAALLALGDAAIAVYEAAKRARGALDFSDLIDRARLLLSNSEAAAWVQFKLDQGIDHVLVDEAQDTNPAQWDIVTQLTQEFFAGQTARPGARTIFAVGDDKQSIYSFQGASPAEFGAKERFFREAATGAGSVFRSIKLVHSFRSTQDVLTAVDRTFARPGMVEGVSPGGWQDHVAIRAEAPGRVEIWPPYLKDTAEEPEDWTDPLDRQTTTSPVLRLANRIADEIAGLTAPGHVLEGTGKQVRPKDILVLVRSRGPFVDAMNRVMRERGIPASGSDRLDLFAHIAVKDLVALGRVLLLPEDDLTLATVLKSPLIGLSEDDLFAVAAPGNALRDEDTSLWEALGESELATARAAHARLETWRRRAATQSAFAFFGSILAVEGGRRAFLDRLGNEVDEVLDEFLASVLSHEQVAGDDLVGFLQMAATTEAPIKREIDEDRDEVRVMTVHGAKGLEAPVVFLVDGGGEAHSARHDPPLLPIPVAGGSTVPLWKPSKETMPAAAQRVLDGLRDRQREEYRRLLYVAMTRAADRLIVCCHAPAKGPKDDCWYARIANALLDPSVEPAAGIATPVVSATDEIIGHVWRATAHPAVTVAPADPARHAVDVPLPDWIDAPVAPSPERFVLRPSSATTEDMAAAGSTKRALFGGGDAGARLAARQRGTFMHRLLDVLPDLAPDRRATTAHGLATRQRDLDPAEAMLLADAALALIADPAFAAAFAPGSRGEVPIVGEVTASGGRDLLVSGRADRLVVTETEVLVVDYKTDAVVPHVAPDAYVGQLALYTALLGRIFPGHAIRAAILWTAAPRLDAVDPARLAKAVAGFGIVAG